MLSLIKFTLSISLALIAVVSAVPQGLGFDTYGPNYSSGSDSIFNTGSDLNYGSGSSAGFGYDSGSVSGLGLDSGSTTEVPVSPISIVPETDFLPINNVRPIVNVFPPNINDYSNDYNYNNYGNYGGLGAGSLGQSLGGGGYSGGLGGLGAGLGDGSDLWSSGLGLVGVGGPAALGTLGAGIPAMMSGGGLANLGALSAC